MYREIRLLGSLSITDDGLPSPLLRSAKSSALLAYLILQGNPVSREQLADLLWDAETTTTALRNLRVLINRNRAYLPDIVISEKQLAYLPPNGQAVDYLALMQALSQKERPPTLANLRLYRGDLLTGFYLEGAPRFQEWLTLERERLRRTVTAALNRLCQALAAAELWAEGAEAAAHWLMIDDLDEEAMRWRMQLLTAAGQATTALAEYEQFRHQLQHELELAPAPETEALVMKLRHAYGAAAGELFAGLDFSLQLTWPARHELAPAGPLPTPALVPFRRNPNFTGREDVLRQLARQLVPWPDTPAPAAPPFVIVSGMGGLGKTQLAVEFAFRYGRFFPGGVFWFNFESPETAREEIAASSGIHGLGLSGNSRPLSIAEKIAQVQRAWQEPIPRLLIFDNCDQENLLHAWLPVNGGCRVLVTSRSGQWESGTGGEQIALPVWSPEESVAFLQQITPQLETGIAHAIAEEVGNLPLALHLSGRFLHRYPQITPGSYLEQIRKARLLAHPSLRGQGARRSPTDHHLDVAHTFAVSLDQLRESVPVDQAARQLLAEIVCFSPGELIPHDLLVEPPAGDGKKLAAFLLREDGLDRLAALGIISFAEARAVHIHRLLSLFALDALPDTMLQQAQENIESRVNELLAAQWANEMYLGRLPLPASQLRHLADRALPRQDSRAARLANFFGSHLDHQFEWQNAKPYYEAAVAIWTEHIREPNLDLSVSLTNLGYLYLELTRIDEARRCFEKAVDVCQAILGPDHPKTAESRVNLAIVLSRAGQFELAEALYLQALAILERDLGPFDSRVAYAFRNLGLHYRHAGQYERARQCLLRALSIEESQQGAEHPKTARTLFNLGYLHYKLGDYDKARAYYERSFAIMESHFGSESVAAALAQFFIGMVLAAQGEYVRGEALMRQGMANRLRNLSEPHPIIGQTESYLANALIAQGRYDEAESLLQHALKMLANMPGYQEMYADTLDGLGRLAQVVGETEAAERYHEDALAQRKKWLPAGHPSLATTLVLLGECHQAMGKPEAAQACFQQAREILVTAGRENFLP